MVGWRFGAGLGLALSLVLGLVLGIAAPAAAAPPQEAYGRCRLVSSYSQDEVIAACTTLLEGADLSQEDRSSAYVFRGNARYIKQDYAGAIEDITQSNALKPQAWGYLVRGSAYLKGNAYDEAIADFGKAYMLNPSDPFALVMRGDAKLQKEDYAGAIKDLGAALAVDPKAARANTLRGEAYVASGEAEKAMPDLDRALALNPKDAEAYLARARLHFNAARYPEAVADFTQVIALEPNYAPAFTERGFAYWKMGEQIRAIADHDRAAEVDPANVMTHAGRCLRRMQANIELETAYAACTRAVEVKPAPEIVHIHGFASLRTGRWDQALADFQQGVEHDEKPAGAYFGQGIAKLRLGRQAEGEADIETAKQLDPKVADQFTLHGIAP